VGISHNTAIQSEYLSIYLFTVSSSGLLLAFRAFSARSAPELAVPILLSRLVKNGHFPPVTLNSDL